MAKTAAEKQADLLSKNQAKIDAITAKIADKGDTDGDKVEKLTATVAQREKSLAKAKELLAKAQDPASSLNAQKVALESERAWLQSMPVGGATVTQDPLFPEDEEIDEDADAI
jgi:hypothetical protein